MFYLPRFAPKALLGSVCRSVCVIPAALPLFAGAPAHAEQLSITRLFQGPDLSGPRLQSPQVSPDGKYVTYLQGKADNKDQLDLWAFDTQSGKASLLVDSRAFVSGEERLSTEEAARRERQRTANLRGIVEYQFSADGRRLLVPLGGDLYIYDLQARGNAAVRRLTKTEPYETDARFSPLGNYVSFVRDQNLWVVDLRSGAERAITSDGRGVINNGVAEFVAQEEMDRDTGYWWAPDESRIAFTRTDDSSVPEVQRFEIYADTAKTVTQRYPYAGANNTAVELKVIELSSNRTQTLDVGLSGQYLARVDWFPDSQFLAVQRESRNQQQLDLLKVDVRNGRSQSLITETSKTWVNLGNNIAFIRERRAFVWASERTGFRHFYLYDENGEMLRPLTAGAWMVTSDASARWIDAQRGLIFFHSTEVSPLEQQLHAASLDTLTPEKTQRISREQGWHTAVLLAGFRGYLDTFSAPTQPPSVAIRNIDGSLRQAILSNALDATHPYAKFLSEHTNEEFGSIKAADGQALFYRLIKPKAMVAGKKYPVIFDTYGGPGVQHVSRNWAGGPPGYFRQLLAQNGFIVFSLDNRGSARRGTSFAAPIYKRMGKVEIEDQVRGAEFLKTLDFVDADRMGFMGWSYGGYMTLMALSTAPKVFKAGVAGAPVTDWRLYDTHYTERYLSTPQENADGYQASSVSPYIRNMSGKLLLVHGMADDNVLFSHSTQLIKQMQTERIPFDLMTYPGGKHGLIRQPEMGQHYYDMALRFFKEKL